MPITNKKTKILILIAKYLHAVFLRSRSAPAHQVLRRCGESDGLLLGVDIVPTKRLVLCGLEKGLWCGSRSRSETEGQIDGDRRWQLLICSGSGSDSDSDSKTVSFACMSAASCGSSGDDEAEVEGSCAPGSHIQTRATAGGRAKEDQND